MYDFAKRKAKKPLGLFWIHCAPLGGLHPRQAGRLAD